VKADLGIM